VLKKAQQLISRTAGYNSLGWKSTVKTLKNLIRKYQSKQDKSQFQKADQNRPVFFNQIEDTSFFE
jgi:hypothetical protein